MWHDKFSPFRSLNFAAIRRWLITYHDILLFRDKFTREIIKKYTYMPANLQIYFRPLLLLTYNSLRVSGILLLPLHLGKDLRILSNSWRLCWRRRYLDRLLILKMTSIYALTEDRFLLYVSLARPLLTQMPLAPSKLPKLCSFSPTMVTSSIRMN